MEEKAELLGFRERRGGGDIYATDVLKTELLNLNQTNHTKVGQQLNSYDMNKCWCQREIQDKKAADRKKCGGPESAPCRWLNKHHLII